MAYSHVKSILARVVREKYFSLILRISERIQKLSSFVHISISCSKDKIMICLIFSLPKVPPRAMLNSGGSSCISHWQCCKELSCILIIVAVGVSAEDLIVPMIIDIDFWICISINDHQHVLSDHWVTEVFFYIRMIWRWLRSIELQLMLFTWLFVVKVYTHALCIKTGILLRSLDLLRHELVLGNHFCIE